MSEFILNGNFDSDFSEWENGPGTRLPFVWDVGRARATGEKVSEERFWIEQEFSLTDEPVSAIINVWAQWDGYPPDGYAEFYVDLRKPSAAITTLYHETKTGVQGSSYILNAYNLLSDLDEYGTYAIVLICDVKGGGFGPSPSHGWFDNISIEIAVKKYKSIAEKLGGQGLVSTASEVTITEVLKRLESLAKTIYHGKDLAEEIAVSETLAKLVKVFISEGMGIEEALFKGADYLRTISEAMSLNETLTWAYIGRVVDELGWGGETLSAILTQGNVQTSIEITTPVGWDSIPAVTTNWDTNKTEIF